MAVPAESTATSQREEKATPENLGSHGLSSLSTWAPWLSRSLVYTLATLAFFGSWELGGRLGVWSTAILPNPSDILAVGPRDLANGQLVATTVRTTINLFGAIALGVSVGAVAGVIFWKFDAFGRMVEPYMASFYSVPLVVFYPIMLVILGVNSWPIVILASAMAAIPMALNTWIGLAGIKPVYVMLGESLCASRTERFWHIYIPAALPVILAGVTLAAVYALIGVVAMEFMMGQVGIGHQIRYLYESFDNPGTYFYILVTFVLALVVVGLVKLFPRALHGRATSFSGTEPTEG